MSEKIVKAMLGILGGATGTILGKQIIIFVISMLPILELRGGLLAASLLKLNPVSSYIICMIGNILPIPFILWFIDEIIDWMRKSKTFKGIANWLDKKVIKNKGQIEKYGYWGLALFVGIPLPGTGAWTGCLIASALHMDKKKSFLAALVGVFIASIIMMIISYGVIGNLIG